MSRGSPSMSPGASPAAYRVHSHQTQGGIPEKSTNDIFDTITLDPHSFSCCLHLASGVRIMSFQFIHSTSSKSTGALCVRLYFATVLKVLKNRLNFSKDF